MEEASPAQLHFREVYLLDISLSGALVEHSEPVNLGEIYRLSFPVEGKEVQVLARAIRAFATHRVTMEGGERRVVYRTGMEFVGLEEGVSKLISDYVERLPKQGSIEGTN